MADMLTLRGPDPLQGQNNPIVYNQIAEYRETFNGKVVESTRVLLVGWDERKDLLRALLATARVGALPQAPETFTVTPFGLTTLSALIQNAAFMTPVTLNRLPLLRLPPEPHPELPFLVAQEGGVLEGKGYISSNAGNPLLIEFLQNTANAANPEGKAKVAVTYRSVPYVTNLAPLEASGTTSNALANAPGASEIGRYVWRQGKPSSKLLPIQGTYFRELNMNVVGPLSAVGPQIPEPTARPYPFIRLTYNWIMVPALPPAIFYQMSLLNQTAFDVGNFPLLGQAPIGQTQYESSEWSEPYFTWHGDQVFDLRHSILFRQPGFNWRYRPQLGYHVLAMAFGPLPGGGFGSIYPPANNPAIANPEPMLVGQGLFNYGETHNLFKLGTGSLREVVV